MKMVIELYRNNDEKNCRKDKKKGYVEIKIKQMCKNKGRRV